MTLTDAISALTDLGILPVITVAASIAVASMVYRRFRR